MDLCKSVFHLWLPLWSRGELRPTAIGTADNSDGADRRVRGSPTALSASSAISAVHPFEIQASRALYVADVLIEQATRRNHEVGDLPRRRPNDDLYKIAGIDVLGQITRAGAARRNVTH